MQKSNYITIVCILIINLIVLGSIVGCNQQTSSNTNNNETKTSDHSDNNITIDDGANDTIYTEPADEPAKESAGDSANESTNKPASEPSKESINKPINDVTKDPANNPNKELITTIAYMGKYGHYLADGRKGWHDMEYVKNIYLFNSKNQITQYNFFESKDAAFSNYVAYTFLDTKSNILYFSMLSDFKDYSSGIYKYDFNNLKLERITNNPEYPYLIYGKLLESAFPDKFNYEYLNDYRDIEYHDEIIYYINTSPEFTSLGLYSLDQAPKLISNIETELILKIENDWIYFIGMDNKLYKARLDGSVTKQLFTGQVDNNILINDENIIMHSKKDSYNDGLYLIDKTDKVATILQIANKSNNFVSLLPKAVINNYLYYEHIEGEYDKNAVSDYSLNRINLTTKKIDIIIPNYESNKYQLLDALDNQLYFLDDNNSLYRFNSDDFSYESVATNLQTIF